MGCYKCTTTPDFPTDTNTVYVWASHNYITEKIYNHFKNDFTYTYNQDYLLININIKEFIHALNDYKILTRHEEENTFVLPFNSKNEFSFSMVRDSKNLIYWLNLYKSSDLKWILDNESIITYFQPVIDINTKKIKGYECLSRGIKKDGDILNPSYMFNLAKKAEMVYFLDRLCRMSAIKTAHKYGITDSNIFINFTPSSIYNPEYCLKDTVNLVENLKLDIPNIVFEVVEFEKITEVDHLKDVLDYYRQKGFKVALDDVGEGYSSLKMLAALKPDIIKLDTYLIKGIEADSFKRAIVEHLVNLSKKLDIMVLAEGIETHQELETAVQLKVDLAQGYLFGKPAPKPVKTIPALEQA